MGSFRTEVHSDGVAIVTFDAPGSPVNTLSPAVIEEFESEVLPLLEDPRVRAVVLASGKRDTFIAGADLKVLEGMHSASDAEAMSRRGNVLLSRVAASRKPVVAAIHGATLGGGLEVALACHYLLASDDPATVLALPEVMLGVLPGGGGTQRLPRRIGLAAALPLLLTGQRLRARKAFRLGLVDALTTPGGIADTAARAALLLADGALARRPLVSGCPRHAGAAGTRPDPARREEAGAHQDPGPVPGATGDPRVRRHRAGARHRARARLRVSPLRHPRGQPPGEVPGRVVPRHERPEEGARRGRAETGAPARRARRRVHGRRRGLGLAAAVPGRDARRQRQGARSRRQIGVRGPREADAVGSADADTARQPLVAAPRDR